MGIKTLDFPQTAFDMWSVASVISALFCGAHPFQVSKKESTSASNIKLLQKQIDILGHPGDSWPAIAQLPRWDEHASKLKLAVSDVTVLEGSGVSADLSSRFASNGVGQRAMSSSECNLVACLFQWRPSSRLTADQAVSHPAWHAEPLGHSSPSGSSVSSVSQECCSEGEACKDNVQKMISALRPAMMVRNWRSRS